MRTDEEVVERALALQARLLDELGRHEEAAAVRFRIPYLEQPPEEKPKGDRVELPAEAKLKRQTGRLRWTDRGRGLAMITPDNGGPDIPAELTAAEMEQFGFVPLKGVMASGYRVAPEGVIITWNTSATGDKKT